MKIQSANAFFEACFPDSIEKRFVGVENEYPVVTTSGEGISYDVIHALYAQLAELGWLLAQDGTTGVTVAAYSPDGFVSRGRHMVTTDAGFYTLEIGLAAMDTVQEAEQELKRVFEIVLPILAEQGAIVLGYGIQPKTPPSKDGLAARGRYRILSDDNDRGIAFTNSLELHSSPDGKYKGDIPYDYGIFTLSAAGQTHIDLQRAETIPVVNALNITAGLRIALFANSSVWKNTASAYKANRELFWEWGWTIRKNQTTIPPRFFNLEHYLGYIFDFRGFMVERDNTYYRMDMGQTFRNFFESDGQPMKNLDGDQRMIEPEEKDIHFQCGTAWFTARLQSVHGTVEDRCPCCQPPDSHFANAALVLGLVENNARLVEFADQFSTEHARGIRLSAAKHGMQASFPEIDVPAAVATLVEIAEEGLAMRGYNEGDYLAVLRTRLENGISPADEAVIAFEEGGISGLIDRFNMQRLLNDD